MDDQFTKRVDSAAVAAWWTVLIGAVFLSLTWGVYVVFMHSRPDWLLTFWGGSPNHPVTWDFVQTLWLWVTAVFKLILWVIALVAVWLSLWARGLRKA